jgi:hypothetical protein
MQHTFNVELAKKHGIEVAIFLNNIAYWVNFNKNEGINFYEGRYWTFNKIKNFPEHFPYWSHKQIERIINKCISDNLLVKGCFNKLKYDRTCWYSLTDFAEKLLNITISRNREMEIPKSGTSNPEIGTPIPNINTDNKLNIKDNKAKTKKTSSLDCEKLDLPSWLNEQLWEDFKQHRKELKKPMTMLAQKKMINQLFKLKEKGQDIEFVINNSIANGWQGIFEIKSQKDVKNGNQYSRHKTAAEIVWERSTSGLPEFENFRRNKEISSDSENLCSATEFLF